MYEVAKILFGSNNYCLNTPDSDKDYKIVLIPSFQDFINYNKVELKDLPPQYDKEHNVPISLMQFHSLACRGNPNIVEMLFSTEINYTVSVFEKYIEFLRQSYSQSYIAKVWPRFYSALEGLAKNSISRDGVTPKTVSRAFYLASFMRYVSEHAFQIEEFTWHGDHQFIRDAQHIRNDNLSQGELEYCKNIAFDIFHDNKESTIVAAKEFCNKFDALLSEAERNIDAAKQLHDGMIFASLIKENVRR